MERLEQLLANLQGYKKDILQNQKYVMLLEALEMKGKHPSVYTGLQLYGSKDTTVAVTADLAIATFENLFDELQESLATDNFNISLDSSEIDGFWNVVEEIQKIDPLNMFASEMEVLYGRLRNSSALIKQNLGKDTINLIDELIRNEQYSSVVELMVSDKISSTVKGAVLNKIINEHSNCVKKIFDEIPGKYRPYKNSDEGKCKFRGMLDQNLVANKPGNIQGKIREMIRTNHGDWQSKNSVQEFVEFCVEHHLVDINELTWSCTGFAYQKASTAAVAFFRGFNELGRYLYSLPSYKKTREDVRTESDKIIIASLFRPRIWELKNFFELDNFESSPEKLDYLKQVIIDEQPLHPNIISAKDLEDIISILLRRTKKKDYKAMKASIVAIKRDADINLLNQRRRELVGYMKEKTTPLYEQYPAVKTIGDILNSRHG